MSASELTTFIRSALEQRIPRERIRAVLLEAGWPADQVDKGLSAYADLDFPLAVPRPRAALASKEAFLYLLLFTTLAITAFNVGSLLFEVIDTLLPDDALRINAGREQRMRWSLSSVIIAFPLFSLVGWLLYRAQLQDPSKAVSAVKRWITYLSLFITASILIGDLIVLVNALLGGERSARFYLKALVVAGIAGSIFSYYLWDLQREGIEVTQRAATYRRWWLGAVAVVLATLLLGLLQTDSPGVERAQRLDLRRADDLQRLQIDIERYWREMGSLPPALGALGGDPLRVELPRDPVTAQAYLYRITGERRYELCATFGEDTLEAPALAGLPSSRFQRHRRGQDCFSLVVPEDQ